MSATLSSTLEAEKSVGLRKVFCIRLATVRARLLGLSREDERALRREHLEEGVDWHEFGNGLCYAAEGLRKLERVLAGRTQDETEGEGLNAKSAKTAKEEEGRGVRGLLPEWTGALKGPPFLVRTMACHFPNTQVVEVKIEGAQERGFMRVRASEHFLPGMLCWARLERGASNWVFMGRGDMEPTETPVGPRSRGRW